MAESSLASRRKQTIVSFYEAFGRRDWKAMASAYWLPDALFEDPAFGSLRGDEVVGMWHMLSERASADFDILFDPSSVVVEQDGSRATAHWEAKYTFRGRNKVHNKIDAEFVFAENSEKIVEHRDRFPMWTWA